MKSFVSEEFVWRKCDDALNIVTAQNTILLTVPGKPGGPGEPVSPWREEKNTTKVLKDAQIKLNIIS